MKYQIKQKIFSLGDKFIIKDEFGNEKYYVQGKVISLGDKLTMFDMQQNVLAYIEQELFRFLPTYNIYINGMHIARVRKEFTLFQSKFTIESSNGHYTVQGDFFAHEFIIYNNNSVVATVSKKFFSFSDTYGVDVNDNEDQVFILALVIVIDQVLHDNKKNNS